MANAEGVFAGATYDVPLTDKGRDQAFEVGGRAARLGIDLIVSSTATRALQTAEIILSQFVFEPEFRVEARLGEYDMGVLSGQPISSVSSNREVLEAEGAEDPDDFLRRVMDGITRHSCPDRNTLFVTHNGVIRVLRTLEQGISPWELRDLPKEPNAGLAEFDVPHLRKLHVARDVMRG